MLTSLVAVKQTLNSHKGEIKRDSGFVQMDAENRHRPVCITIDVSKQRKTASTFCARRWQNQSANGLVVFSTEQSTKEEHTAHPRPTSRLQGLTSGLSF